MSKIEDSVLPNTNFDIKELPTVYFSENKDAELSKREFIKNTIKQTEEEISLLAILFFSDENIELINKNLVLRVFKESKKKFLIPFQNQKNMLIVMRYVWIVHSRNLDFKIKEQLRLLNKIVVCEILPSVLTNIDQQIGYLKDFKDRENSKFKVNNLPVSTKNTRGTTELPSTSEILHNKDDNPLFGKYYTDIYYN